MNWLLASVVFLTFGPSSGGEDKPQPVYSYECLGRHNALGFGATLPAECEEEPPKLPAPEELLPQIESRPWSDFYLLSAGLFTRGEKDRAIPWFYIGQLRARVLVRCKRTTPDGDSAALAALNATLGVSVNEHAGEDTARWVAAIDEALAWDELHPDPSTTSAKCRKERTRQRAGLGDLAKYVAKNADDVNKARTANGLTNKPE